MRKVFEVVAGLVILGFMVVVLLQIMQQEKHSVVDPGYMSPPMEDPILDTPPVDDSVDRDLVACTMEAKQCPDGSYVGRTGPNCAFAACPTPSTVVDSFDDCVAAGNPVMESYPRQCIHEGNHFVEEIDEPITIFPIRYGEDVSNMEVHRADCAERGGIFNECGSACGPEAENCIAVCSMICEAP